MSLRARFFLYLALVHLVFAGVAAFALREYKVWLVAAEGAFLLSLVLGVRLVWALFEPIRTIQAGVEFIRESDFTTRLVEVSSPEMNRLIQVYNRMVDHLRQERIRSQEQELFLKDIMAVSPSGILTLDPEAKITSVNPGAERLLGKSESELVGRRLGELGSEFTTALEHVPIGESAVVPLQGRRRVKVQKHTFMDRGFARPFLLLEELTEELHQTEKAAYGKLIRMMSHEVNNTTGAVNSLLHSCLSYADQLRPEDQEDFRQALAVSISRSRRMNEFMQGFAEVVRLPEPNRRECDLRGLLEDVVRLLREKTDGREIEWVWDVQAELGPVSIDPIQIEQVFINVIKNAIEAIEKEGRITIAIDRDGSRSFVAVRDTGCGIPPEIQRNLFTPFYTSKARGQGIGLTMVQEILVGHGFDFSLATLPSGETEFRMLL